MMFSISDNLYLQGTPPGAVEFRQVNSLPTSENQAAAFHQYGLGRADERSLQVRVAVAVIVAVAMVAGSDPRQEIIQILGESGIIIFVNQDGRRGVHGENVAHTINDSGSGNQFIDFPRNVLARFAGESFYLKCVKA